MVYVAGVLSRFRYTVCEVSKAFVKACLLGKMSVDPQRMASAGSQ